MCDRFFCDTLARGLNQGVDLPCVAEKTSSVEEVEASPTHGRAFAENLFLCPTKHLQPTVPWLQVILQPGWSLIVHRLSSKRSSEKLYGFQLTRLCSGGPLSPTSLGGDQLISTKTRRISLKLNAANLLPGKGRMLPTVRWIDRNILCMLLHL